MYYTNQNMEKIFFAICSLVIFLSSLDLSAQVTIGAIEKPNKGVLLDLKEDIPDPNNSGASSTRGLAMPRVSLKSYSALTMGDNEIKDINNSWIAHTGLIVYNVGDQYDKCNIDTPAKGIHVWNGSKWIAIGAKRPYKPMTAPPGPASVYAPNTYMYNKVGTPGSVVIPVAKAFDIWDWWGGKDYNGIKSTRRYLTETSDAFTGSLSVHVVWEEGMGTTAVSEDDIVGIPTLDKTTLDRTAKITVPVTGKVGNAVIAVSDGKGIRWSWHIWVTEDPSSPNDPIVYNTGQQVNRWMDRNVGATSATPQSEGSIGLLYQWGRKDPFPGFKTLSGTITNVPVEDNIVNVGSVEKEDGDNIKTSVVHTINHPESFVAGEDWLTTTGEAWGARWGFEIDDCDHIFQYKSEMDPCPAGWRVPGFSGEPNADADFNIHSPWMKEGLDLSNIPEEIPPFPEDEEEQAEWMIDHFWKLWTDTPWNKGWTFDREDYKLGWYPKTGIRKNGVLLWSEKTSESSGYAWSITPNYTTQTINAYYISFDQGWPVGKQNASKGFGIPVRCVKE